MVKKEKTMSIPLNNSIQVSSKHFVDKLESNIIQIARAYAIEFNLKVDPDAKQMTREVIQRKINQLLTNKEREGIRKLKEETVKIISGKGHSTELDMNTYARYVYETLKVAGFDDV